MFDGEGGIHSPIAADAALDVVPLNSAPLLALAADRPFKVARSVRIGLSSGKASGAALVKDPLPASKDLPAKATPAGSSGLVREVPPASTAAGVVASGGKISSVSAPLPPPPPPPAVVTTGQAPSTGLPPPPPLSALPKDRPRPPSSAPRAPHHSASSPQASPPVKKPTPTTSAKGLEGAGRAGLPTFRVALRGGEIPPGDLLRRADPDLLAVKSITTEKELATFKERSLPDGYSARLPTRSERLNTHIEGSLVMSLRHFDAGLRLPFWPEFCEILRYFGIVPAQINPNGVAIIMGFLCFLREERISFDLSVFRRIFAFAATSEGSHVCTLVGTANKVHRWSEQQVVVHGDFGGVPGRPHQPADVAFLPPILEGAREQLFDYFRGRRFDVIFWRLNVSVLEPVLPIEIANELPEKPLPLAKEVAATQSDAPPPADVGEKKTAKGKSRASSQGPARKKVKTSSPRSVDRRSPTPARSPHFHPNYGLGQGVVDAFGRPLVTWSAGENSVSLSTNLPSWSTDWEDKGEAFAVLHAIYGRADAESVMELTPTELAHQSACALARSAELGHYSARKMLEMTDALKIVSKKAIDLGMQSARWRDFEALTLVISQAAEIEAAKKLSECEEKLATSQAELEAAQTRAAVMETRLIAAEGRPSSSTSLPEDPARVVKQSRVLWEERSSVRREIARAAGNVILARLRLGGQLVEGEKPLTVDELIPELLAEGTVPPYDASLPTSSGNKDELYEQDPRSLRQEGPTTCYKREYGLGFERRIDGSCAGGFSGERTVVITAIQTDGGEGWQHLRRREKRRGRPTPMSSTSYWRGVGRPRERPTGADGTGRTGRNRSMHLARGPDAAERPGMACGLAMSCGLKDVAARRGLIAGWRLNMAERGKGAAGRVAALCGRKGAPTKDPIDKK
ncbi:hypothetical protein KSP39_PZI000492 [Platanthera zijinensis]|uniref:Transposase (putative) gypsy type domain-containing protein n=1 Tax=Platanthera zijinensis TaxID=2320716 RepID=A0AAP0C609_9ASPA